MSINGDSSNCNYSRHGAYTLQAICCTLVPTACCSRNNIIISYLSRYYCCAIIRVAKVPLRARLNRSYLAERLSKNRQSAYYYCYLLFVRTRIHNGGGRIRNPGLCSFRTCKNNSPGTRIDNGHRYNDESSQKYTSKTPQYVIICSNQFCSYTISMWVLVRINIFSFFFFFASYVLYARKQFLNLAHIETQFNAGQVDITIEDSWLVLAGQRRSEQFCDSQI